MSLTPGTRLGAYDITAQIGVGGMGGIYRATDTNLKRQVAIKVLPASVAADSDSDAASPPPVVVQHFDELLRRLRPTP